jgi:predicted small secreted protein
MTRLRLTVSLMSLLASGWLLSACNTVEGAGEDLESAGEEIQEEADEHD